MRLALSCGAASGLTACGAETKVETGGALRDPGDSVLVVFNAVSLARPLRAALDSFALREGVTIHQESAGSFESARKLTELGRVPDLIALADREIFPALLMPRHVAWYVAFARNRMVLAYTPRSRRANELTATSWPSILLAPTMETGHAEPGADPAGYRAVITMRLAELHYARPGLADSLRRNVPARNIRPRSSDLVAMLHAGELDYAWMYESVARAAGLRSLALPKEIDLGSADRATSYRRASARVPGRTSRDSIEVRGEPIVFALSMPFGAPHPALAERAAAFLLSPAGRAILRAEQIDVLDVPEEQGTGVPPAVAAAARASRNAAGDPR